MLHDPKDRKLFPKLGDNDIGVLRRYGEIVEAKDGDVLQEEGAENRGMFIVLDGRLRAFRRVGSAEELLAFHSRGGFSGDLSVLTRCPAVYHLQACGAATLLRLDADGLRKLIAENMPVAEVLLEALTRRARQTDSQLVQEEKLAALGKMAAGLAHELNNPATAAGRASKLMLETVKEAPLRIVAHDRSYTEDERNSLREFAVNFLNKPPAKPADPIEISDREQELCDWIEQRNLPRGDEVAPVLAEIGITAEFLESWQGRLGQNFVKALFWIETVTRLTGLARDIETSTNRIADLVGALKEYSYMDQARYQEVDVHQGIENTLKILSHKLKKGVTVKREYAADLPKICAYAGELNQVWTNLIDNAVDAMDGRGEVTIRTRHNENRVIVEVADTGRGIPENIQNRIFEPFFTTKSQGKGTGLGLDITHRIVVYRHGGRIRVRSKPGDTVFEVDLPIEPPKESEILAAIEEEEAMESNER
jgi:signal transduction histidine kinase